MEARAAGRWVPAGTDQLDAMVKRGLLTEAEEYRVRLTIEWVITLVRIGRISQHFGDWIVRRLAFEMAQSHSDRLRGA